MWLRRPLAPPWTRDGVWILSPRRAGVVAIALALQIVLALAIGRQTGTALLLALLVAFVVLTVLEPRVAFCGPLFYLILAVPESTSVSLTDLILLVPPAVVACSFLSGGDIARRAGRLILAHRFKLVVVLFAALVVMGVAKGFFGGNGDGALQPVRLAIAPVMLFGLAVFRSRRELLHGLRIVFYPYAGYQLVVTLYYLATGGSATAAEEVSTGGTRVVGNSSAMYLSIGFILLALHLAQENRVLQRIGLVLLMGASVFTIMLALARTTWAAAFAVIVVMTLLMPEMRRGLIRFAVTVAPIAILGALLVPVFASSQLETIRERVKPPEGPAQRDYSAVFRQEVWGRMLDRWEASPLFGGGFGQTVRYQSNDGSIVLVTNDPHNGFIFLLVATGIVGLTVFLLVQLGFMVMAVRALRTGPVGRGLGAWALGTWVIFATNVFTGVVLGSRPLLTFLWVLLSIPVALAALPEERDGPAKVISDSAGVASDNPRKRWARSPRAAAIAPSS